ncbi:class I SAM-dependent methyltransferase [Neptuniibacter sp. CAU 1671]|uniref:class I SAM-dependent methyltransferase n=1 Tax=Neptuniibacter sp. CAU 1671 TaxID=3032593 RepID=UPI0023DABB10|nr:class I SAM-dependent methyltransferase [Neptuniibacter sp. CAU 1671]MDF2181397.1 class I SAM-dependent methyltransferase [Neptuniibacter sp. CAU 1671]
MLEVLQKKEQIKSSRLKMIENGMSCIESGIPKFLRKIGVGTGLSLGDFVKSWDVEKTLSFIDENLSKNAKVLDLGAFCSEVPVSLARKDYVNVYGVDLNDKIDLMPYSNVVEYVVGDFMKLPFESSFFDAVTAISVIEHGYQPERLFSELGRILKPGGFFIASFDYWPEKISTGSTRFFDMSWMIFSEQDVYSMLEIANKFGLIPYGDLNPEADEHAVKCAGFDYTFGWLVLRKES